ncbi:MAG: hypothetical protein ACPGC6_02000 [Flavobacteriaceae bacterium]|jgi:hypothetical protein
MRIRFLLLIVVPIFGFGNMNKELLPIIVADEKDSLSVEYDIKRVSAGLKFGFPYMAVVGAQYTLPFFDNHFAPYFDYSQYSYEKNNEDAEFRFLEWGISYFFKEKSKGLYVGLSNSNLSYKVNFMNVALENGSKGSGNGKVDLGTTNLRLGLKTGGAFYFRIEMGYGFGDLPKKLSFRAIDNSDPSYSELSTKEIPEINGVSESGMLVGNIGFGISF